MISVVKSNEKFALLAYIIVIFLISSPTNTCGEISLGGGSCEKPANPCYGSFNCHNNGIGEHIITHLCECLPDFYGDPHHPPGCVSCANHCNNRTVTCHANETCLNCDFPFQGKRCDECPRGQFVDITNLRCVDCNCNGHATDCSKTGSCFCLNSTQGANCTQCKSGWLGEPADGRPCFLVKQEKSVYEEINVLANTVKYIVLTPRFTNVDMLITVNVNKGKVIASTVKDPLMPIENATLLGAFSEFREELVISSASNNFREERFYVYLKAMTNSSYRIVFSQTVVQIDLFIFFSVFFAAFFLFLTALGYVWQLKMRYERNQAFIYHRMELRAMRSRPVGSLKVVLTRQREFFDKRDCSAVIAEEYLHGGTEALVSTLIEFPTPKDSPPRVAIGTTKAIWRDPNVTQPRKSIFSFTSSNRIADSVTGVAARHSNRRLNR